jgi:hypothetical protein
MNEIVFLFLFWGKIPLTSVASRSDLPLSPERLCRNGGQGTESQLRKL